MSYADATAKAAAILSTATVSNEDDETPGGVLLPPPTFKVEWGQKSKAVPNEVSTVVEQGEPEHEQASTTEKSTQELVEQFFKTHSRSQIQPQEPTEQVKGLISKLRELEAELGQANEDVYKANKRAEHDRSRKMKVLRQLSETKIQLSGTEQKLAETENKLELMRNNFEAEMRMKDRKFKNMLDKLDTAECDLFDSKHQVTHFRAEVERLQQELTKAEQIASMKEKASLRYLEEMEQMKQMKQISSSPPPASPKSPKKEGMKSVLCDLMTGVHQFIKRKQDIVKSLTTLRSTGGGSKPVTVRYAIQTNSTTGTKRGLKYEPTDGWMLDTSPVPKKGTADWKQLTQDEVEDLTLELLICKTTGNLILGKSIAYSNGGHNYITEVHEGIPYWNEPTMISKEEVFKQIYLEGDFYKPPPSSYDSLYQKHWDLRNTLHTNSTELADLVNAYSSSFFRHQYKPEECRLFVNPIQLFSFMKFFTMNPDYQIVLVFHGMRSGKYQEFFDSGGFDLTKSNSYSLQGHGVYVAFSPDLVNSHDCRYTPRANNMLVALAAVPNLHENSGSCKIYHHTRCNGLDGNILTTSQLTAARITDLSRLCVIGEVGIDQ